MNFLWYINCNSLENQAWFIKPFDKLADKMYCISEVSANPYEYNAAIDKYCDIILKNIEKGYDPNEKDSDGNTPLMAAAILGCPKLVKELLNIPEIKKNINLRNNSGLSALDLAIEAPEMSCLFLNPSIRNNPLEWVSFITLQSYYSFAPFSAKKPYSECVELLKKYGAEQNPIPLKTRMKNKINQLITIVLNEYNNQSDDNKKIIESIIKEAKKNLEKLEQYNEDDDFGEFCIKNLESPDKEIIEAIIEETKNCLKDDNDDF